MFPLNFHCAFNLSGVICKRLNREELVSLGYSIEPDPDRRGEVDNLLDLIQIECFKTINSEKGNWLPQ